LWPNQSTPYPRALYPTLFSFYPRQRQKRFGYYLKTARLKNYLLCIIPKHQTLLECLLEILSVEKTFFNFKWTFKVCLSLLSPSSGLFHFSSTIFHRCGRMLTVYWSLKSFFRKKNFFVSGDIVALDEKMWKSFCKKKLCHMTYLRKSFSSGSPESDLWLIQLPLFFWLEKRSFLVINFKLKMEMILKHFAIPKFAQMKNSNGIRT